MTLQVLYVWGPDEATPAHLAAGKGSRTSCGIKVHGNWTKGYIVPDERAFCERCQGMQYDTKADAA